MGDPWDPGSAVRYLGLGDVEALGDVLEELLHLLEVLLADGARGVDDEDDLGLLRRRALCAKGRSREL